MTQRGWAMAAVAAAVVAAALTAVVARWGEGRYERDFALRMATTTAAYLAIVTPPARRGSVDYDVRRLLTQARALRTLPIWTSEIEVYYGTAPLVDATGAPLSPDDLAQLRGGDAARWADGLAVVPLWDRDHREVVGAVAVRPRRIPRGAFPGGGPIGWALPAALVAVVVAGGVAFRGRPFRRYLLASAVLALAAYADVRSAARRSTDRWLTDTRLLLQEAAIRLPVPGSRASLAELTPLTRGAELVPGEPGESAPRRFRVGGMSRAAVAVLIGPGRWVELRTVPLETFTTGWLALLFGCAFLGPLGVFVLRWAEQMDRRELRQAATAWSFLAPAGLHLVVFTAGPILFALYLSVHRWGLVEPIRPFVGLSNFAAGLRDPLVWIALRNTALYALYVPISAAIALAVALVLGGGKGGPRLSWGARLLRGMFFLPYVLSVVAMALVWQRIFQSGAIGSDLLRSPKTALLALMVISIWAHVGYQMVVFLAGLERIPRAYLDAAQLDGAGAWRRFWRITFPLLRPVTLFVLVTGIIGAFQVFTYVYVLTGGGPLHATDVLVYRIYRIGFEFLQFGVASALSLLVFLLLLALTRGQVKLLRRVAEVEHA